MKSRDWIVELVDAVRRLTVAVGGLCRDPDVILRLIALLATVAVAAALVIALRRGVGG